MIWHFLPYEQSEGQATLELPGGSTYKRENHACWLVFTEMSLWQIHLFLVWKQYVQLLMPSQGYIANCPEVIGSAGFTAETHPNINSKLTFWLILCPFVSLTQVDQFFYVSLSRHLETRSVQPALEPHHRPQCLAQWTPRICQWLRETQ